MKRQLKLGGYPNSAADELILEHLSRLELKGKRILVLNDSVGVLSGELEGLDVTSYTDSFVSANAIRLNSFGRVKPVSRLEELAGVYDLVLTRIPKNMSFFEDILCHLSQHLGPESKVIASYMIKYQSRASFDLLSKYVGRTSTSLAQKKARLIFAPFERTKADSPYPLRVAIESFEHPFVNQSNVFSREKLDIGSRFLLEHIPRGDFKTILDLGCANGIIGIAAKRLNPSAQILFNDDSAMAIESARTNYQAYFSDSTVFNWTHCAQGQEPDSVALVLCNPPFHEGHSLTESVAWQMFKDAHRALVPRGTLRVIGNSHLRYQLTLKRIFGSSEIVATNSKFMIVDAHKS